MFALAGGSHGVAYPAQTLYSHLGSGLLHDITEGGNGECEGFYGDGCSGSMVPLSLEDCGQGALICNASAGYDGPSGVGTADGVGAFAPTRTGTHGAGSPEAPLSEACGEPIGATQAKACGTLDPHVAATVGYRFAYNSGKSCLGGRETALVAEAQREHSAVSAELVGLEPDTEYAYCLIATDTSGETEGSAVTFTTGSIAPRIPSTAPAANIATETVTLEGRLTAERAPTVWYFEYAPGGSCSAAGASRTPEVQDTHTGEPIEVRASVAGLEAGTEYSACLIARNAVGASAGAQISFMTEAIPPRVLSVLANAGSSEATIEGHVLPGAQHAKCELEYGPTEAYGIRVPCNEDVGGAGATAKRARHGPGTRHRIRLPSSPRKLERAERARRREGHVHDADPRAAPERRERFGSGLLRRLLSGAVAPEGARTRYWFEYGETEAFGQSTPGGEVPAGTGVATVAPEAISGLTPGTLYHYRLRAKNKWHEAFGETQTFTTASDSSTVSSGGPPTTSSGGSELGASLTPAMTQPLAPASTAPTTPTTPTAPTAPKKTTKKVAECKRGEKREHGRCLKQEAAAGRQEASEPDSKPAKGKRLSAKGKLLRTTMQATIFSALAASMLLLALAVAPPGAWASGNANWGTGVELTAPAGAAEDPEVYLREVSCPSAGNCTAAGSYTAEPEPEQYRAQGELLSETGGAWEPAVEATMPAGAASSPGPEFGALSCPSAGELQRRWGLPGRRGKGTGAPAERERGRLGDRRGGVAARERILRTGAERQAQPALLSLRGKLHGRGHLRRHLRQLAGVPGERDRRHLERRPHAAVAARERRGRPGRTHEDGGRVLHLGGQLHRRRRLHRQLGRPRGLHLDRDRRRLGDSGGGDPARERRVRPLGGTIWPGSAVVSFAGKLHRRRRLHRQLGRHRGPHAERDFRDLGHRRRGDHARERALGTRRQSQGSAVFLRGQLHRGRQLHRPRSGRNNRWRVLDRDRGRVGCRRHASAAGQRRAAGHH